MVLHITNDYSGSSVYKHLARELDHLGMRQIIYSPVKEISSIGKNKIDFNIIESEIIYSHVLNKTTDRIFYKRKIKKIVNDTISKIDFSKITLIHAHTWYSDGGVAYELSKKLNIPYIITVRSTDLNVFFKYLIHLRGYGKDILQSAQRIIFISPCFKTKMFSHSYFAKSRHAFSEKSMTIPNGIDSFWIENAQVRRKPISKQLRILYIGTFIRRKNVLRLIEATRLLSERGTPFHLELVGGGGSDTKRIMDLVKKDNRITYHGKIYDKSILRDIIRNSDIFAMPSYNETFGLVYLEALSQGIPILYTKDDGIDGYYPTSIGEAVNSKKVNEIVLGLERIHTNYERYSFSPENITKNHDWSVIAKRYESIYYDVSNQ